jgi:dipeptidyl aminopeptidase/acylaminoacyl peptidase
VITIDMCLSGRDLTEPRPSPDGSTVAFVARWGGSAAIVTVPLDGGPERLLTTAPEPAPGRGFGGGCFDWVPDGSGVVYVARDGHLWLQPVPGGPPRRVCDVDDERAVEAPMVGPDGSFVVATVDMAEVRRWWLDGSRPSERLDDGSADFVLDPWVMPCGSGVLWQAWNVPDMAWDSARVQRVTFDGAVRDELRPQGALQQPRTTTDGVGICVRDDTGWNNVWLGDAPLVDEPFEHGGPTWGPRQRSFAVSPDGHRVAFSRNERGFGRLCVVDVASRAVTEVGRGVHGQIHWADDDRIVALRSGARTPTQIVVYHAADWSRRVLAVGPVSAWDVADLPEPTLVDVEREGAVLHARRYPSTGPTSRGLLCWVHGGPTDQWQVEFLPRIAYWCAQGFDVLVPDHRGSTGHGRAYQRGMQGEWGRLDVDDVAAIVADSHRAGTSEPSRTVALGSSAGGLTVLGLLGLHPGLAAGGVVLYPVTDLAVLAAESHRYEAHYTIGLVAPLDDVERYRERSPMSYADRIDVPLLVMHGDSDPVVPVSSTLAFADRMRAAGRAVELHVFPGEGHGFRAPEHRRADFELTAAFLARVVGPASG